MSEPCCPTVPSQRFTLAPDARPILQTLSCIGGHYPVTANWSEESAEQISLYLDTADYRLLRTGFAVRLEQIDNQFQLTIENLATALDGKLDKRVRRRTDLTALVADGDAVLKLKQWPKALYKAVASVLNKHAKLHPIVELRRQEEFQALVMPPSDDSAQAAPSAPLAQIHGDRVTVWSPRVERTAFSTPPVDGAADVLRQLRIEFCAAEESVQEAITTWLTNQPALQPAHQPLVEQAMLAASRYAPGASGAGLQPQMPMADACRLIWREQLMGMLLNEAGMRYSQENEYVHEMRVAIRRMRAAAKLYGHFFARKEIRPFLAALQKTGRLLGQVRNLDVTIAKARRLRLDNDQGGKVPKKLIKEWQQQRRAAHQTLVQWLDSEEYSEFLAEFQCFCTTPAQCDSRHRLAHDATPTPEQVRHVIPPQLMEGFAAVRCYEALFAAAMPVADNTLHELRIACKHLRYNLEFARHLLGAESKVLIKRLKRLQDLLGEINDAIMMQTLLGKFEKDEARSAYQQAQAQLAPADRRARVPAMLATFVDQDSREQLGKALACL